MEARIRNTFEHAQEIGNIGRSGEIIESTAAHIISNEMSDDDPRWQAKFPLTENGSPNQEHV